MILQETLMKRICTDRSFKKETCYPPRPMTQSERARLQPGDHQGRFKKSDCAFVFMDEAGDTGKVPICVEEKRRIYNPSRIFGFGCSVVTDRDSFGNVSINMRRRKGIYVEMKTRKLEPEEKIGMAADYRKTGTRAIGVFIDKNSSVPKGWIEQSGSEDHVGTLLQASRKVATNIPEKRIHFVIDNHDSYQKEGMDRAIEEGFKRLASDTDKTITYKICRSSSGKYRDELQTNDIVPHSLILKHERCTDSVSKKLNITEFKLDEDDEIWIDGNETVCEKNARDTV